MNASTSWCCLLFPAPEALAAYELSVQMRRALQSETGFIAIAPSIRGTMRSRPTSRSKASAHAARGGLRLQKYFRDGSLAEQMRVPTENAVRLGSIEDKNVAQWCALGLALVPYGGFLAAGLRAGETVLVSGATGNFGSAAVAVALAMGAACVVAPGRNEAVLQDLARRFGPRLCPFKLTGDEAVDREGMQKVARGPIDCVLDIMPPSVGATVVRAALMTVRPYGASC